MKYSFPNFLVKMVIRSYQKKAEWKDIPKVRRGFERLSSRYRKPDLTVEWKEIEIRNQKAAWLIPMNCEKDKVLLYFHGGGYNAGSHNTHRAIVGELAKAANIQALSLDYRLAPENKFPAAIEDAEMAFDWLINQGFHPSKIAFGGDSAGGGLCIATLLYLRDKKKTLPACAIGLSPWLDLTLSGTSHQTKEACEPMLLEVAFPHWINNYIGETDAKNPYLSPIYADLKGLPPIYIQVGSCEVLLDDSVLFYEKAKSDGAPVELEIFDGYFHVFQSFFNFLSKARKANKKLGNFISPKLK